MGYNGSLTAQCWKVHTCVNCGGVLRYAMSRSITAQGNTQEQCRENLANAAVKQMNEGVDLHPCPSCGMVQPEMVAAKRSGTLGCMAGMGVLLCIAMAIGMGMEFAITSVMLGGIFAAVLIAAVALLTALDNPNANLQANQRKAHDEMARNVLFHEGQMENAPAPSPHMAHVTDGKNVIAFACIGLGLCLMGLPEVSRVARGWTANPGWFPAVVGPGDQSTYYFHKNIVSIKGYWKGQVKAELDGYDDKVGATTNDNSWGDSISAKSSETAENVDLWSKITFPPNDKLAGKNVKVQLVEDYVAPVSSGSGRFTEQTGKVEESPALTLSPAGAGTAYKNLAWLGVLGGCGLLAIGCLWLSMQAGRLQGNPHHSLKME